MNNNSEVLRAGLEKRIKTRCKPVLLVSASDGAEAIALKNGLTCADLMRPFATLREVSYPFRIGGGGESKLITLSEFSMRVSTTTEIGFPQLDTVEALCARAVAQTGMDSSTSNNTAFAAFSEATLSSADDATR